MSPFSLEDCENSLLCISKNSLHIVHLEAMNQLKATPIEIQSVSFNQKVLIPK